ncbi:MAG: hypothetical protein RL412_1330 [Pseudomonadota bacterium]|jgi:Protein of unknown function VcgC/VcgE (DUF2780)
MKRRDFLRAAAIAAPAVLLNGPPAAAQLPGGIDELVRELGFAFEIPLNKAVGGTGALLHVARERLSESEFAQISAFISGVERLIQQATNVVKTAMPKSMGDMPAVMEKLGLPAESTNKFSDFILEYLRERGGRKPVGLLQKAWKG